MEMCILQSFVYVQNVTFLGVLHVGCPIPSLKEKEGEVVMFAGKQKTTESMG